MEEYEKKRENYKSEQRKIMGIEWAKDFKYNKELQEDGIRKVVEYYTKIKNMEV